jgi:arginyl-tRNA synthetase
MDVKGSIEIALKGVLSKLGIEAEVALDHPAELSHGDYSCNVALAAAKKAGKNPKVLAEEILKDLGVIEGVESVSVAGAGFLNFKLSNDFFPQSIAQILSASRWGANQTLSGKRYMYEYTDPNPFKVFHIGHLMSNAIGESLARITEYQGASVVRANYQGDIGPHVAKCIWGLQKENLDASNVDHLGKAYVAGSSAYEDSPDAKAEIDAINKKLYANDSGLKPLYELGRKTSLEHFEELYALLGTKFDHYFFESVMGPIGVAVVEEGLARGVFEKSDGAVVYKGEKVGLHTRVFLTSQGTPTYETKELGLDKTKFEKEKLDHSIIVTAVEQAGFFKVVLAAMAEVLPDVAAHTEHVWHGMMQLTGGKMSSRKGNVITGESLIQEMREEALQKMEGRELGDTKQAIADVVAVSAIKYSILKQASGKNIIFDPEASLSFEGDSGPYLQYAHVRALSILRKAQDENVSADTSHGNQEPTKLERLLYRFPEVVERAYQERESHHVTTFLTELASTFNSWYAGTKIVDATDVESPYKVALTQAFAHTMKNGLWLLGIQAPEKM